jgi:hypothetical protein
MSQHILTPPPSPEPRINGAKVFGVRPGNPFFFKVPATGKGPLNYSQSLCEMIKPSIFRLTSLAFSLGKVSAGDSHDPSRWHCCPRNDHA